MSILGARLTDGFLLLPGRDPHDLDRVADHVGGAVPRLATTGPEGWQCQTECLQSSDDKPGCRNIQHSSIGLELYPIQTETLVRQEAGEIQPVNVRPR